MKTILSLFREICGKVPAGKSCLRRINSDLTVEKMSYQDLAQESDAFASYLCEWGCVLGDRVLILTGNSFSLFTAFWGAMKAGAIPCILFPSLGIEGVRQRLELAQANFFCFDGNLERFADLPQILPNFKAIIHFDEFLKSAVSGKRSEEITQPEADDPAFMIFTSGSTGTPKPILHRQGMAGAIVCSMRDVLHASVSDVYWCTAHPAWITGAVYGVIGPLLCGMETIQYDGNFHAKRWLPILQEQKVSLWYSSPTAFRSLMRETPDFFSAYDLSSLKQIYSIGEPLPPAVLAWGEETFRIPIYDTWFQTETGTIRIAARFGKAPLPGSMGCPVEDSEVLILDGSGHPVPAGQIGKLCLRVPWDSCCIGIFGGENVSRMKAGHYETGDLAYCDAEGNFFFSGRADDVLNISGHLVGPAEIESALMTLPEIRDVGVAAEPDPLTWEHPVAFIVLNDEVPADRKFETKVRVCVNQFVSAYALPKRFVYLDALPRTENGKLNRSELKKLL